MTNTCLYSGWLGSATLLGARDIAALNASDEGRGADTAATIAVLSVPKLVQACLVFTLDERGHRTLAAGFDGSAGQAAPQNSS